MSNYDKFKFVSGNRPISESNVNSLVNSIQRYGYQSSKPITVNKDFEIIDGQHRFIACKKLGLPIIFEFTPDGVNSDELMIELNKTQRIWRLAEYINHYAEKDIPFYVECRRFEEEHKLGVSNTLALCGKTHEAREIRKGINIELNENRHHCVEFIKACHGLHFYKNKMFVESVKKLFELATKNDIEKVKANHFLIPHCPSRETYMTVFENIINKRSRNKISLNRG